MKSVSSNGTTISVPVHGWSEYDKVAQAGFELPFSDWDCRSHEANLASHFMVELKIHTKSVSSKTHD